MISIFDKNYPKKLTATFLLLNSGLIMAELLVKQISKQKHGRSTKLASKPAKSDPRSINFSHSLHL